MLTAFGTDGTIDWKGMDGLTEWYVASGVAGIFGVCLSSEMNRLCEEESFALARHLASRIDGRTSVVVPCPLNTPHEQQPDCVRTLRDASVDAVALVTNQLSVSPGQEDSLLRGIEQTLEKTDDTALGVYECPCPFQRPLSPDLVGRLASTDRFVFYKETTAQIDQIAAKCQAAKGTRLRLFNAHIRSMSTAMEFGASGPCSIAVNYFPELLVKLCENLHQKPQWASRVLRFLNEVEEILHRDYPRTAKKYLRKKGVPIGETCRVEARNSPLPEQEFEALFHKEESLLDGLE